MHVDRAVRDIQISPLEAERFTETQTGTRERSEQGQIGRRHSPRCSHERLELRFVERLDLILALPRRRHEPEFVTELRRRVASSRLSRTATLSNRRNTA